MPDTKQEQKRLERVYSEMGEGELEALAQDAVSLTPEAVQALAAEIARRRLDIAVSTSADESGSGTEELVTIRSFQQLSEAMLAKGILDSAGIQCLVLDDTVGSMLASNAVGGFRMQVNQGDAEAAIELLTQSTAEDVPADPGKFTEENQERDTPSVSSSSPEKTIDTAISRRTRLAGLVIVLAVSFLPLVISSVLRVVGMRPEYPDDLIRYRDFNALLNELIAPGLLAYVIRQNGQSFSDLGLGF